MIVCATPFANLIDSNPLIPANVVVSDVRPVRTSSSIPSPPSIISLASSVLASIVTVSFPPPASIVLSPLPAVILSLPVPPATSTSVVIADRSIVFTLAVLLASIFLIPFVEAFDPRVISTASLAFVADNSITSIFVI